jgi:hypothetical protein
LALLIRIRKIPGSDPAKDVGYFDFRLWFLPAFSGISGLP